MQKGRAVAPSTAVLLVVLFLSNPKFQILRFLIVKALARAPVHPVHPRPPRPPCPPCPPCPLPRTPKRAQPHGPLVPWRGSTLCPFVLIAAIPSLQFRLSGFPAILCCIILSSIVLSVLSRFQVLSVLFSLRPFVLIAAIPRLQFRLSGFPAIPRFLRLCGSNILPASSGQAIRVFRVFRGSFLQRFLRLKQTIHRNPQHTQRPLIFQPFRRLLQLLQTQLRILEQ
jgi:hypothetical protein